VTVANNIQELYRYRALMWALVGRHLSMRYRGSFLGFLWTFLNPLCLMLVYMLVFKYYIRFDGVDNYTIFLFAGLLPWLWVSSAIIEGTSSIASSGHLITKSMFPAHLLPTVAVLTTMINFIISLPLLFVFMLFMGVHIPLTVLFLPVIFVVQLLFLQGISLALSSLNVQFRDVQHIVANLLTFLFFLSPILYPPEVVPDALRFTLDYNPLAVFTICYHNLILDGVLPSVWSMLFLLASVVVSLLAGTLIFNRYREGFAELL